MTALQIREFQALEMAYLDSVRDNDGGKQMEMMELIFFWLRKQVRAAQSVVIIVTEDAAKPQDITEIQKQEFTFLQIAMIKAVGQDDRDAMVQVELKMREWVDMQITAGVNRIIRPELKIIRKFES
jgi:hypothetical protein